VNFRDAYEFDPGTYDGQSAGGLLGMLKAVVPQDNAQPDVNSSSPPNTGSDPPLTSAIAQDH
jgi:hypothetical protein